MCRLRQETFRSNSSLFSQRCPPDDHLTSLPSIEQQFQGANRLEIQANIDDVWKYYEDQFACERRLAQLVNNDWALQESIVAEVVAKLSGMYVSDFCVAYLAFVIYLLTFCILSFLLAKPQMDSLVSK